MPTGTLVKYQVLVKGKAPVADSTMVLSNDHFDRTVTAPAKAAFTVSLEWGENGDTSITHTFVKYFPQPVSLRNKQQ